MTGQITVTTAGTRVQGSNVPAVSVIVKGHPSNTGTIWVGSSTVTSSTGFPLEANGVVIVEVLNLNELWFDASVSGEKACYILMRER